MLSHNLYVHDCRYILERNALIPRAERMALKQTGLDNKGKVTGSFSRAFMRAMDDLWRIRCNLIEENKASENK